MKALSIVVLLAILMGSSQVAAQPSPGPAFYCGAFDSQGAIVDPVIPAGGTGLFSFFYSADENLSAFTLSLEFNGNLDFDVATFSITGTVLEAVGTEFIFADVDSNPADGDGCEIVAELILDSVAPFDGQTAPITTTPLEIAHMEVSVSPFVPPSMSLFVIFFDGLDGNGATPYVNSVTIAGGVVSGVTTLNCSVQTPAPTFIRGDVNGDGFVNALVDVLYLLAFGFLQGPQPPCFDAADVNDDGSVNALVDGLELLGYGFLMGPPPAAPFPDCGFDPTTDSVGCANTACP